MKIKRYIVVAAAIVLCLLSTVFTAYAEDVTDIQTNLSCVLGDVDNDGNVTAADARLILRAAAKLTGLTETESFRADISRDGYISAKDAREVLRMAAQIIPRVPHELVSDLAVAATCEKDGLTEGAHCKVCNEVIKKQETVPATGHDYTAVVTDPNCIESGFTTYTCSKCSNSYIDDEIASTGHTESVLAGKAPTCTETGLTEGKKCSVCEEVLVAQETVPATGHTEEKLVAKASTCTETGLTEGKKCSVCEEVLVAQEVIAATGHIEEILVAKASTCTETGLTEGKKCSVCEEVLVAQETVPATGHTEEVLVAKAPTCTETGLTEGKKCSVCEEVLVAQEVITATGHTEEVLVAKASTCTETGLTEGKKCSVCEEVLVAQEVIAATGHTEEILVAKAPTCTETGLTEGKKCSVCEEVLVAQETVPATGHTEEKLVAKAPTCTETGLTEGKQCSVCEEVLVAQEIIAATGHTEEILVAKAPTCTETGLTEGKKCSVCEEVLVAQEIIAATGHTEEILVAKASTCTETGLTEGKKCSVCEEILVAQEVIAATGHTEEILVAKASTCTETGLTEGKKCSVCEEVLVAQEVIAATGHTEEILVAKAPTCTETGLTEGKKCSVCEEVLVAQEVIPATGHQYGEWSVEKASTCVVSGIEKRICDHDPMHFEVRDILIDPDAHDWDEWTTETVATCTEKGTEKRFCKHNSEHVEIAELPIDLNNHKAETFYTVDAKADCENDGSKSHHCERCDKSLDSFVIEKRNHAYDAGQVTVESTCIQKGIRSYTCTNIQSAEYNACSHSYTVDIAINPNAHSFNQWYVSFIATCTEKGIERRECQREGCVYFETKETTTDPDNHKAEVELTVDKKADCKNDGSKSHHCERCDEILDSVVIEKRDHNYDEGEVTKAPTCTEKGVMTYTCTNVGTEEHESCTHSFTDEIDVDSQAHDWDEWSVETAPTCTEKGTEKRYCKYNAEHVEIGELPIEPNNHKAETFYTVDVKADCENDGSKSYHCERCDEKLYSVVIPKRNHDLVSVKTSSTCSDAGEIVTTCTYTEETEEYKSCSYIKTELIDINTSTHLWTEWFVETAATCSETGTEKRVCEYNSTHIETREIAVDPDAHKAETDYTVDEKADCENDGSKSHHCEYCDKKLDNTVIEKRVHVYDNGKETTAPTCTEKGVMTYTCTNVETADYNACSDFYTEEIPALDHVFGYWYTEKEPTCIEKGIERRDCQRAGCEFFEEKELEINVDAHDWDEWYADKVATCAEKGIEKRICRNNPEHVQTRDIEIDSTAHDWSDWTVISAATCSAMGIERKICKNDSTHVEARNIKIDPDNHYAETYYTTDVQADCENDGSKSHHCAYCDMSLDNEIIKKRNHAYDDGQITIAPTCIQNGIKLYTCVNAQSGEYKACSHSYMVDVPKLGHNMGTWYTVAEATCTETGLEQRDCLRDDCNYFEENEIAINPDNHKAEDEFTVDVKADCENDGSKSHHCERCDISLDSVVIEKRDHNYDEGEVTKVATCTETGTIIYTCTNEETSEYKDCEHFEENVIAIDADNHKAEDEFTVDVKADCEKDGSKSHHCERCDEILDSVVIGKRDHNYDEGEVTKVATCTETGTIIYTCTNDETEEHEACVHSFTDEIDVDSQAHDWDEWSVETAPTCTEKGTEKRHCKHNAEHVEIGELPIEPSNHKAETSYTVDAKADCENDGSKSHHCERCDQPLDPVVIEKREHNYDKGEVTKTPTCTEKGVMTYTCTNVGTEEYEDCAHAYTEDIQTVAHSLKKTEEIPESDFIAGEIIKTCEFCQTYKESERISANIEKTGNIAAENYVSPDSSVYHPESYFGLSAYGYDSNRIYADNAENYVWAYDEKTKSFKSTNESVAYSYSTMSVTVEGAGIFSFDYSVSSEGGNSFADGLILLCDGEPVMNAYSEKDWSNYSITLTSGMHKITWLYSKNGSVNAGNDSAYVKNISFEPKEMATMPAVSMKNGNETVNIEQSGNLFISAGECYFTLGETEGTISVTVDGESVPVTNNSFAVDLEDSKKVVITSSKTGCIDNVLEINLVLKINIQDVDFTKKSTDKYGFETVTIGGESVLRSANKKIPDSSAYMYATLDGPGSFVITYAVSSQKNNDEFTLTVDGNTVITASGNSSILSENNLQWITERVYVSGEGTHEIIICYSKSQYTNSGLDAAYVKLGSVFSSGYNKIDISYDESMGSVIHNSEKTESGSSIPVKYTESITLTATPSGKVVSSLDGTTLVPIEFDGWYVNGEFVSDKQTLEFTPSNNSTVRAEFKVSDIFPESVVLGYDETQIDFTFEDGEIKHHVPFDDNRMYTISLREYSGEHEIHVTDNGNELTLMSANGRLFGIIDVNYTDHEISIYATKDGNVISEIRTIKISRTADVSQLITENSGEIAVNTNVNSDYPWIFSSEYSKDGIIAFVPTNSGVHNSYSNIAFTFTAKESGVFNFYSYISTETNRDKLAVSLGKPVSKENKGTYEYSGLSDWQFHSIEIEASETPQTVYIAYSKDQSTSSNEDIIAISDVAFLSGNVDFTLDVKNPQYGNVTATVNGVTASAGTTQVKAGSKINLKASAANGAKFLGWADTQGNLISFDAECTVTVSQSSTVTATFAPDGYYAARVDGVYYTELEQAVHAAKSGDTVVLLKNWTLKESITVEDGVTFVVPCVDKDVGYAENGYNPDGILSGNSYATTFLQTLYCTLTVPEDVTITVNGTLLVNAQTGREVSGSYTYYDITGGYGKIVLGGSIVVNNGGVLDCSGYIVYPDGVTANNVNESAMTANSMVTLLPGAVMHETYSIDKWRGGTYASMTFYRVYPIYENSMNNMRATLRVESGATLNGTAKAYSGGMYYCRFPQIDNTNGVYRLSEGAHCIRTYEYDAALTSSRGATVTKGAYRDIYKFYGGASFDRTSLYIAGVQLATDVATYYNVDGDMAFELYDGVYTVNECFQYMPGFIMTVGNSATVDITANGGWLFMDTGFYTYDSTFASAQARYTTGRATAQLVLESNASVNCAGALSGKVVFETDGSNYASLSKTNNAKLSVTRQIPNGAYNNPLAYVSHTVTFAPENENYSTYSWTNNKLVWQ